MRFVGFLCAVLCLYDLNVYDLFKKVEVYILLDYQDQFHFRLLSVNSYGFR